MVELPPGSRALPLEHCRSPSWGQSTRTNPSESVLSPEQRRLAETPRVCWGRTLPGSPMAPPGPFEHRRLHRSSTPAAPGPPSRIVHPDGSRCPLPSRDAGWQGATAPGEIESTCHQCSLKHYPGPTEVCPRSKCPFGHHRQASSPQSTDRQAPLPLPFPEAGSVRGRTPPHTRSQGHPSDRTCLWDRRTTPHAHALSYTHRPQFSLTRVRKGSPARKSPGVAGFIWENLKMGG